MTQYQRMGEWLISMSLLTRNQLSEALRAQRASRGRLGEVLTSMGWVTEDQVVQCLSAQYSLPIADLDRMEIDPATVRKVSLSWAQSHLILPVRTRDQDIDVVVSDPIDVRGTDEISRVTGLRPRLSIATPTALFRAIAAAYALPVEPDRPTLVIAESAAPGRRRKPIKVDPQVDRHELLVVLNQTSAEPSMWSKLTGS